MRLIGAGWVGFTALLCLGFSTGSGQDTKTVAKRIIEMERDHSQAVENLAYLSDVMGPRLTGSKQLLQANQWTAKKMTQYGLENVHLEAHSIPVGWVRGAAVAKMTYPHERSEERRVGKECRL